MSNGTPHFRYRFLVGAMPLNQLTGTVRLMCIPEDIARLPQISQAWRGASARMVELANEEVGEPDGIAVEDPPAAVRDRLAEIEADPLFKASFSATPTSFKVVEINKLVAPQRDVNLDYVASLQARIPGLSIDELIEFCVGPRAAPPDLKMLQTAQNQMTFSSLSLDLRFLGGFPKPIGEDDISVAHSGGQPVEAVALLIGYGAAPIRLSLGEEVTVLWTGAQRKSQAFCCR